MLRRGDQFQMPGVVCPDCRGEVVAYVGGFPVHATPTGWCTSDRHPIFDERGYLVQMTPRARGEEPERAGLLKAGRL